MRKLLYIIGIVAIICTNAFATGDKTITSKNYVDTELATKQDKIPAVDNNTVITHTGTVGNIGEKGVYDSSGDFVSQYSSLVTAGDANTGINNALENEFICIDWDTDGTCLIWQIKNTSPQQILPTGYTALEYIESTGTQYINTNTWINKSDNARMDMVAQFSTNDNGWVGANAFMQLYVSGYYSVKQGGTTQLLTGNKDNIVINYENYRETLYVNNQLGNTTSWGGLNQNKSVCMIFALGGYNGSVTQGLSIVRGKIYKFALNINNVLVRSMIPARRNSDSKLGMYDTVSNTFFTNQGAGEFTAGPDLDVYIPSGN